MSSEP